MRNTLLDISGVKKERKNVARMNDKNDMPLRCVSLVSGMAFED